MGFLEHLDKAKVLVIKQKKELAEILVGWESKNNYVILDDTERLLGYISESTKGFWNGVGRVFLRKHRSFEAVILDENQKLVFQVKRPFYFIWSDLFLYNEEGRYLGSVHRKFSIFFKKYHIRDKNEKALATLKSPFWRIWTFPIKDQSGRDAGKVTKKWTGILKEVFTDTDTFAVDFEAYPWKLEDKSLILATAISIDFDYFEDNSGSRGGLFGFGN